jgi:hypothetical protein
LIESSQKEKAESRSKVYSNREEYETPGKDEVNVSKFDLSALKKKAEVKIRSDYKDQMRILSMGKR